VALEEALESVAAAVPAVALMEKAPAPAKLEPVVAPIQMHEAVFLLRQAPAVPVMHPLAIHPCRASRLAAE
jgi:hypothetical protein